MEAEGVVFKTNTHVGKDITAKQLLAEYDSIVLAMGAERPRDLNVPGRELKGVYFAMDFLTFNNKKVSGDNGDFISAKDKNVIVIGGGDTGSDCVGTSNRHGAKSVTQIELFLNHRKTVILLHPGLFIQRCFELHLAKKKEM